MPLAAPVKSQQVVLSAFVPVKNLIDYLHIDIATFKFLNPGLRPPVYSGQKYIPKGYQLRLPVQNRKNLVQLAADIPDSLCKLHQKRSNFYLVRQGDTVGNIARRQGVRVHDLIFANQLDSRAIIYVGQNLRIPRAGEQVVIVAKKTKQPVDTRLASLAPCVDRQTPVEPETV